MEDLFKKQEEVPDLSDFDFKKCDTPVVISIKRFKDGFDLIKDVGGGADLEYVHARTEDEAAEALNIMLDDKLTDWIKLEFRKPYDR